VCAGEGSAAPGEGLPTDGTPASEGGRYMSRLHFRLAAGGEEGLKERGGFACEDAGDGFNAVIQARMREDFEARADGAATRIVGAINEPGDAGLDHGAGAHGARFEGDVESDAGKAIVGEGASGFAEDDDFGVSGGVVVADGAIAGTRDDFVFADDESADGNFSGGGGGGAGFVESELHEV